MANAFTALAGRLELVVCIRSCEGDERVVGSGRTERFVLVVWFVVGVGPARRLVEDKHWIVVGEGVSLDATATFRLI